MKLKNGPNHISLPLATPTMTELALVVTDRVYRRLWVEWIEAETMIFDLEMFPLPR